ncbi:putative clathrin assembly protein [Carex littledalei]|uniref:Putative clathrin assembly protein n=1 Tax=Carex littledalei TaxID=544730 RepID=A0A833QRX1_9POAL|nr:putative clathrin assembly protein [Carex littledalei]
MSALQSWRKAYGAMKDHTSVGIANLNSDFKDLDVAIVKATNHFEIPPKERHLRKILGATSIARPRADVAYCIHALARRLAKTRNWTVALKTLIVIHRLLREGDPTFREELLNFSQRAHILQLANFKDESSPIAWDCSAWVRTYALFLEERLECFRVLKYDMEAERLSKPSPGAEKGHSRMRELESEELLEHMPALQQLLYRLVGCRPEGAANSNYLVQYALALVLKESFKIYCAINDGIINLVDKFFEMPRHEAIKALEIYRRAGQQAGNLSDFYEECRGLELARNFQFPTLREPPQSFLNTMEEYIREAPRMMPISTQQLEMPERLLLTYKVEAVPAPPDEEEHEPPVEEEEAPKPIEATVTEMVSVTPPAKTEIVDNTGDLLGLNDTHPTASAIEESNALALAIVPTESVDNNSTTVQDKGFDPTGWELALVSIPSSSTSSTPVETHMAGGFDKLTLDSLYDEAAYRQQQQQTQNQYFGPAVSNPFMSSDPFAMSTNVAPPPSVQMAAMANQQYNMPMAMPNAMTMNPMMHQPNPFMQAPIAAAPAANNPFLDAGFGPFPVNNNNTHNPYGGSHQQLI